MLLFEKQVAQLGAEVLKEGIPSLTAVAFEGLEELNLIAIQLALQCGKHCDQILSSGMLFYLTITSLFEETLHIFSIKFC